MFRWDKKDSTSGDVISHHQFVLELSAEIYASNRPTP